MVSSEPRKYECTISWNATAKGIVSAIPIVRGDGPRETPTGTQAVRNSKLPTLSVLEIVAGLILPRGDAPWHVRINIQHKSTQDVNITSDLLEGGLGMDIYPEVGVGVCRVDF